VTRSESATPRAQLGGLILPANRHTGGGMAARGEIGSVRPCIPIGCGVSSSPPSAIFSWRDGGQVHGPRYCWAGLATWQTALVIGAGLALARSFPREGARGKVLGGQSQNLVAYGLELREYFANRVARLAKWQSAPAIRFRTVAISPCWRGKLIFTSINSRNGGRLIPSWTYETRH
jgi:hypothetical protein